MKNIDYILDQLEEFRMVNYRIGAEGLHYCFKHYSSFSEVKDDKFHELREKYLQISDEIQEYVNKKINELEDEVSTHEDI